LELIKLLGFVELVGFMELPKHSGLMEFLKHLGFMKLLNHMEFMRSVKSHFQLVFAYLVFAKQFERIVSVLLDQLSLNPLALFLLIYFNSLMC
jgi:hypothetical protein